MYITGAEKEKKEEEEEGPVVGDVILTHKYINIYICRSGSIMKK